jgi:hypothetical protein
MRSMKRITIPAAVALLAIPVSAANGIVITLKTTRNGAPITNQIQIDANHMRAEIGGAAGGRNAIVFDGVKQVMDVVELDKKTYTEISKADLDALSAQLSDAMAQMQKQAATLPPEQRAQVEAMMRGRGMPGAIPTPVKPIYKKVGTDTVGKWKCDKYEGYSGDRKTSEVCATSPAALGLTAADFAVSAKVAEFFSKVMPTRANEMFSIGTVADRGYDGVPVRSIVYGAGGEVTTELTDVSRQNIPESAFAVPAGFQKMASPFAGRGRGRAK